MTHDKVCGHDQHPISGCGVCMLTTERDYWRAKFEKLEVQRATCCADMEAELANYKTKYAALASGLPAVDTSYIQLIAAKARELQSMLLEAIEGNILVADESEERAENTDAKLNPKRIDYSVWVGSKEDEPLEPVTDTKAQAIRLACTPPPPTAKEINDYVTRMAAFKTGGEFASSRTSTLDILEKARRGKAR